MKYVKAAGKVVCAIWSCAPVPAAVCALCSLVYAGCAVGSVRLLARLFQAAEGLSREGVPQIVFFAVCYLLLQLLRKAFNLIQDLCWNVGVEETCKYRFRMKLYKKAAGLPYIDFEDARLQDCLERAESSIDSMTITQSYINLLAVAESVVTVTGLLVAMIVYSIWYLPVMLVSVLPLFLSRLKAGKEFYQLHWFQAPHIRKRNYFYSVCSEPAVQKEQRIFGFGAVLKERWEEQRRLVAEETLAFRSKDSQRLAWCETLISSGYLVSILLSFFLTVTEKIAVGVFGAGIFAFKTAQDSTEAFFALCGNLPGSLLEAENYFRFLNLEEEAERTGHFSGLRKGIRAEHVEFCYPNTNRPALCLDELVIPAGERVVMVGENGSGKSTLVKLLLGLYTPQKGRILYDDTDLNEISKEELAALTAALSQDSVPYHLPVCDMVRIRGAKQAGEETIRAALEQTGITEIGDLTQWLGREFGGKELSGGQWQRLAIAGVLCKPYEVIFLDEPTSALDPNLEYDILRQFMSITKGKTAVIISHRVGLCRLADRVVFLKDGFVKGVGPHACLMRSCGEYADFYNEQAKWHM